VEVEGYPRFISALFATSIRVSEPNTATDRFLGEIMFVELLSPLAKPLTSLFHTGHRSVPALDDNDGACPACDYPFGELNHMCFGGPLGGPPAAR
jgi:hypothetical protein